MISDYLESFHKQQVVSEYDDLNSEVEYWSNTQPFQAVFGKESSLEARLAFHQGLQEQYGLILPATARIWLQHGDRIQRDSTGVVYVLTSDLQIPPITAQTQCAYATVTVVDGAVTKESLPST